MWFEHVEFWRFPGHLPRWDVFLNSARQLQGSSGHQYSSSSHGATSCHGRDTCNCRHWNPSGFAQLWRYYLRASKPLCQKLSGWRDQNRHSQHEFELSNVSRRTLMVSSLQQLLIPSYSIFFLFLFDKIWKATDWVHWSSPVARLLRPVLQLPDASVNRLAEVRHCKVGEVRLHCKVCKWEEFQYDLKEKLLARPILIGEVFLANWTILKVCLEFRVPSNVWDSEVMAICEAARWWPSNLRRFCSRDGCSKVQSLSKITAWPTTYYCLERYRVSGN